MVGSDCDRSNGSRQGARQFSFLMLNTALSTAEKYPGDFGGRDDIPA